ncbi:wound-induced protein 1 [Magnolia sinica]|uniref:wound-induced protein 1 n=1 Tax=Magnolia sinica TaxID=86752 RepID=UPI00265844C4|nr:wound-induced protein 1 [Magnolia sinica]
MQLLTGDSSGSSFEFVPQTIKALGSIVLVEGHEPNHNISWVHAWTVSDGVIIQVREYFNTSLTVTRLDNSSQSSSPSSPSSSSSRSFHCLSPVWESRLYDGTGKSMPGLVLAI